MRGARVVAVSAALSVFAHAWPVAAEPDAVEPTGEPAAAEPVAAEPADAESVSTPAAQTEPAETEPVETEPVETEPVGSESARPKPARTTRPDAPAATVSDSPEPSRQPGDRMVQAGVGVVVAGLLGYGLMAAGLGIGNRAETDLNALPDRDDISTRRDVLARGRLGNQLAIAGAVTATVAMAVGIPLIAIGRRRHEAGTTSATLVVGGMAGAFGAHVRGRF